MSKNERASVVAATKGSNITESPVRCPHWHFITGMMTITTLIAEQCITGFWSGMVALMCAISTILMVMDGIGGREDVNL